MVDISLCYNFSGLPLFKILSRYQLIIIQIFIFKFFTVERRTMLTFQWDNNGKEHYFWRRDPQCGKFRTRFVVRHSLQTRALVSYPGSGNSWTRYLLEAATGVFTGSFYRNKGIIKAGLYGEARDYRDGSTLLQKTHHNMKQSKLEWRQKQIRQFGGRGVLVIRNPYKAIISFYNFKAIFSTLIGRGISMFCSH